MLKLLRSLFLVLFATALVWGAVVWHWQHTGRDVGARDVAVYLVALPLVVIVGFIALRWAWRRADTAQTAASQAAASASAQKPAAAGPTASEQERLLAMQVLGAAVVLPGADDARSALDLAAEPPTLKLDPQLRDVDGLGVFTRRCEGLEPAELDASSTALQGAALAHGLALGERCVDTVLQAWPQPEDESPASEVVAVSTPSERPALQLLWAIDEDASAEARAAVEHFVRERVPRWAVQTPGLEWRFELVAVRNGEALLLQAERRLVMAHRQGREDPVLVIAAQSLLDERRADRLDAEGRLFTAQRGQGVMLGEAGAALLLAPPKRATAHPPAPAQPAPPAALPEAYARLHRLSAQRRDKSADDAGRVSGDTLAEAMRQALSVVPELKPEALPLVVTDTDSQRSRVGELAQALQAALPALSLTDQCRRMGLVCGFPGLAAAPVALALAAAHAQAQGEPVLALAHADPHDRLAALITPVPRPEPASTAT